MFEDISGNALAGSEAIGDAANPVRAGVNVYLFDDSGTTPGEPDAADGQVVGPLITDGSGAYSFTGIPDGTYFVVVDSATVAADAG